MKNRRQLARHAFVCVLFYQYSVPDGTAIIIKNVCLLILCLKILFFKD
jgi:hypothetical protein